MTLNDIKKTIEQRTGVPAALLNGDTGEECISQAKALLVLRREMADNKGSMPAASESFAAWFNAQMDEGAGEPDDAAPALEALDALELGVTIQNHSAPTLRDAGEIIMPDQRSTRDKFAEWFNEM